MIDFRVFILSRKVDLKAPQRITSHYPHVQGIFSCTNNFLELLFNQILKICALMGPVNFGVGKQALRARLSAQPWLAVEPLLNSHVGGGGASL